MTDYMAEMGAPKEMIDLTLQTNLASVTYVDHAQLRQWELVNSPACPQSRPLNSDRWSRKSRPKTPAAFAKRRAVKRIGADARPRKQYRPDRVPGGAELRCACVSLPPKTPWGERMGVLEGDVCVGLDAKASRQ